jgi:ABC-2 type transport system permease protein
MRLGRYLRLLAVGLRTSLIHAMQYRLDFIVEGLMSVYWLGWNLLPLLILYDDRTAVAGWDYPSALVVIAWFVILRGVLEGAINPSLVDVVERLRTGSFDYTLLKPADAQFRRSTFSPASACWSPR